MKSIALVLGVLTFTQNAAAATLFLSGTVPDRGFTVQKTTASEDSIKIVPNDGSELKVFVAVPNQGGRSPASEGTQSSLQWKVLTGPKTLTASCYVRVEAP